MQDSSVPGPKHFSVMLRECLDFLGLGPENTPDTPPNVRDGIFLDCTAGLGGHTAAMAGRLQELAGSGWVLSCDRDAESLAIAKTNVAQANTKELASRIRFRQALFSQVEDSLAAEGITQLDGLLADLGVSRYQLTGGERGFSFMADGPLDMQMSRGAGQTAADLVNYESEGNLANLIYTLGEERRSRQIARAIVRARPISTTHQLARLIEGVVPRTGKIHPATQTFMALRMAVNRELEELDALLALIPRVVKPGGRVAIITFMSIEDRKVKQSFQAMAKAGQARLLNRHVVRPSEEEIWENPASRSAKLRALELL